MSNASPPETTTKQSAVEPAPKKEPKPVPAALSDFLLGDKVSAHRFVQLIAKRTPLAESDLARSHEIVSADPSRIGAVVELARAAAQTIPQPTALLRWCEQVVRLQDVGLREWARDPAQDASCAIRDLLTWAYPRIQSKGNRSTRQLAEACLLIGLNSLFARRSLSPLDALRCVASAAAPRRDGPRTTSPAQGTSKLVIQAGVKQLFDLARIAALYEAEIVSAEGARHSAIGLADDLRREKEVVEEARNVLSAKAQDLSRELSQRDSRILELTADLEGARTRALHDTSILKARFRRQVGEGLAGLLGDAWEAIDADPPHPDVARERLEIAREAIRKEMEWLDKSSD